MIELGSKVKDKITGFEGLATGLCRYITGCTQVLVQPSVKPDGEFVDCRWMDEPRLEVIVPSAFVFNADAADNGPDKPAPRK